MSDRERPKCDNPMPASAGSGPWREWHRGHGCDLDPTPCRVCDPNRPGSVRLSHPSHCQVCGRKLPPPVRDFWADAAAEVKRARARFPGNNANMVALMEEVGELARAMLDETDERVWAEAIQVAAMACRVAEEMDATLDDYRRSKIVSRETR